jgi:hypothetical protein
MAHNEQKFVNLRKYYILKRGIYIGFKMTIYSSHQQKTYGQMKMWHFASMLVCGLNSKIRNTIGANCNFR